MSKRNQPCPKCRDVGHDKTGDHLWLMRDGETWACFKPYHPPYIERGGVQLDETETKDYKINVLDIKYLPIVENKDRRISEETMRRFKVRTEFSEETGVPSAVYYPETYGGVFGSYKKRVLPKRFSVIKKESLESDSVPDFFGQICCPKTGKRLVICAGEEDTLAAYEMLKEKYPDYEPAVVGLPRGESGYNVVSENLSFISGFEEVIVATDNDKAGEESLRKISSIVGERTRTIMFSEKDISDMRVKGKEKEFINAYFSCKEYRPSSIITISDVLEEAIQPVNWGLSYPFERLTKLTYGMKEGGEIIGIGAAPGAGKALAHGELVVTKEGFKKIEDIVIGDEVSGTCGWCRVTGVFPQGTRPIYTVEFNDGTRLSVDGDHLWTLNHTKGYQKTITTSHLMSTYLQGSDKKKIYSLPEYSGVEWGERDLPIDPYVLGVWLGDGSTACSRINCPKTKILGTFFSYYNEKDSYYFLYGLKKNLRELNLLGNKHIPEDYLYSSKEQRAKLLSGLLDTDGYRQPGRKGTVFSNSVYNLVVGVEFLARSLGFVVKRLKTKTPFYRNSSGEKVICKPSFSCLIKHTEGRTSKRYVSNVYMSGYSEATCISVDSSDSLYLAGEFIPTHNTTFLRQVQRHLMFNHKEKIAIFPIEEGPMFGLKSLIGSIMNRPIHLPDCSYDQTKAREIGESLQGYAEFYGGDSENWGEVEDAIRYFASKDIRFFFIDPLSALVEHLSASEANTELGKIMRAMRKFRKNQGLTFFHANHLNNPPSGKDHGEGGAVRGSQFSGSRAQWKYSTLLIGLEGNQLAETEEDKHKRKLVVIKDRLGGKTGYINLKYDPHTGNLTEDSVGDRL